jgi:hypothetical protein
MPAPEPKLPPKVSLEDLLRLKRHERPSREFWDRFDREMHQRVWRTLVEPPPTAWNWVRGLMGRRLTWLTAGATAILVVALAWPKNPAASSSQFGQPVAVLAPSKIAAQPAVAVSAPIAPDVVVAASTTPNPAASSTPPNFVVVALTDSAQPAQVQKVPATVSFAAEHSDHVSYAADTLVDAAASSFGNGMY